MSLNADLIRARCGEIHESVGRLERFRSTARAAFMADQDSVDIACQRLLVAMEAALSLCFHVSAKRLRKVPEEYAACFASLRDGGIIDSGLAERLQKMARFRNVLVHVYWKLDYGRVYDVIEHDLDDLRSFATAIARLL